MDSNISNEHVIQLNYRCYMSVGLWSFDFRGPKKQDFWPKIQHTPRKSLSSQELTLKVQFRHILPKNLDF